MPETVASVSNTAATREAACGAKVLDMAGSWWGVVVSMEVTLGLASRRIHRAATTGGRVRTKCTQERRTDGSPMGAPGGTFEQQEELRALGHRAAGVRDAPM